MAGNLKWHSCSTTDFPPKRHKVLKACEACRSKKIKCDGLRPCQRCENSKIACEYTENATRARSKILKKQPEMTSNCSSPSMNSIIDTIDINCLFIKNDLYNLFRLDQSTKSRRFSSSLLPLLLDFFNLTSQPITIWNNFIFCLSHYHENMDKKTALLKEAFNLFISHNLLYGMFIHSQLVSFVLDSSYIQSIILPLPSSSSSSSSSTSPPLSPQPMNSNISINSIVIDSILAITFFSAYQSLPNHPLYETLYLYAHHFYRKALVKFMDACFPTDPADQLQDRNQIIYLVQSTVLLAHFQCQAIHEHQAYMTIRIALDLIHRYGFMDLIHQDEIENPDERENLIILLKTIDAWYVWLSFYLKKQYTNNELVFQDKEIGLDLLKKTEAQKWALQVTDAYTIFFKNVLSTKYTNIQSFKDNLKLLSDASKPSSTIDLRQKEKKNPYRMVHLYHNILITQLLNHQFDQIINRELDVSSQSSQLPEEEGLDKEDLAVMDVTVRSSQNIIATVHKMFNHNKRITHSDYLLPLIYGICQVSQLALSFQKNRKLMHDTEQLSLAKYQVQDNQSPIMSLKVLYIQLLNFVKNGSSYFQSFDIVFNKLSEHAGGTLSSPPSQVLNKDSTTQQKKSQAPPPSSSDMQQMMDILPSLEYSDNVSSLLQDELLLADSNLVIKSTHDQIVSAPPSRTDIDREQLEKLSKPPTHVITSPEQFYYQQHQQFLLPQSSPSSNDLFTKYVSSAGATPSYTTVGKRNGEIMNEYYYHYPSKKQQQQQQIVFSPNKRVRTDTMASYDGFQPDKTDFQTTPRSRHHSMPAGFVDMTTETEEQQQQQHSDEFMYLLMNDTSDSFYNNPLVNHSKKRSSDNLTKLPLPQPSKPTPMSRTWSTSSSANSHFLSSAIFQESEVQTLHYPVPPMMNFEPSSFPMDVIHEESSQEQTHLLYPQHRPSIISDKSSISSHTSHKDMGQDEAAAQAAAAAAASWAVAVEIHQQQNIKKPRERGHWINNEKVPDDNDNWAK